MKYYKIVCSNGYCGCDEEFYEALEDNVDINTIAEEILWNDYCFAEPDERFINTDEDYNAELEAYEEDLGVWYEEITEEEYKENS